MSRPGSIAVSLRAVRQTYANGVNALERLNLDVWAGEFVALLGPSGCGKSTALRIIAGLSQPTSGAIDWRDGRATGDAQRSAAAPGPARRRLSFVFQEPTLMPWATVTANVRLPLKLARVALRDAKPRVEAALARVGLRNFAASYPRELSGGM